MTTCESCGEDTGIGAFYPDDDSGPLCRGCYRAHVGADWRRDHGPDWWERNAEAAAHRAQERRARVVDGR